MKMLSSTCSVTQSIKSSDFDLPDESSNQPDTGSPAAFRAKTRLHNCCLNAQITELVCGTYVFSF